MATEPNSSGIGGAAGDEGLLAEVKQERQRLERFKRWFDQSHRANDEWRAQAIRNRKYVSGEQWSEGDRQRLAKAKRPMLTINKILPRVLFLEGMQRTQRVEPKLQPFEGGDVRGVEIMGALYKWAATQCREPVVDSRVFDDKIVSALGFWKIGWRYDGSDFEGDLCMERVDPLAVFPDPNWLDAGWDHAEYVMHATWMTLTEAMEEWPEYRDELRRNYGEWLTESTSANAGDQFGGGEFAGDAFSGDRTYWDPETQRVRVLECWYKKRQKVPAVLRTDTAEVSTDPQRIATIRQAVQGNPELAAGFQFIKLPQVKFCVAHFTSECLLDDQPSPYAPPAFPLFPTLGYYWWKTPKGMVDPMIDLQNETNRRRSTVIEIVQRAALSGFFNQQDQGAKKEDLENYAAGIGKVIQFKQTPPVPIDPPQLSQTLVFLDQAAEKDMDRVSNIHAELLGTTTQRTVSGKAIRARQQSGLVVQEVLLESFRFDKEPVVKYAIGLLQQFLSVPKAIRILGSIAVRQPNAEAAQMLEGMAFVEVQDLLKNALNAKFDVVISSQPYDPSQQQQQLNAIMELVQQFAKYMPPDVIVEQLKNAGVLTEDQAAKVLAYAQQVLGLEQAQQAAAASGQGPGVAPSPPPNVAAGAA